MALISLILLSPILLAIMIAIGLSDFHLPFYRAIRIGKNCRKFRMLKFRTMSVSKNHVGDIYTTADDPRITRLGRRLRRKKLDELIQVWNILWGEMSLVGPRPQPEPEVNGYSEEERRLLSVRPGVTDLASLVFADEGQILQGSRDPQAYYSRTIQPWKTRFALLYLDHRTIRLDLKIILLTIVGTLSRRTALHGVQSILQGWRVNRALMNVARREEPLPAYPRSIPPAAWAGDSAGPLL
jgi:lipopolysaccharide/colanic/teichoic acid biosynthesis glycosyltransferase